MKLTKEGLVRQVYKKQSNLTRTQAFDSVDALLRLAKDAMVNGSSVLLSGFGKFVVRDKTQRLGRNPKTGTKLMIDARRVVTFKTSTKLRTKINLRLKKEQARIAYLEKQSKGSLY
jgi:integration host factor subunit alpha